MKTNLKTVPSGGKVAFILSICFLLFHSILFAAGNDVSLNAILSPAKAKCGNSNTSITLVISNPGTNSQSKVPYVFIVSGSTSLTISDTLRATLSAAGADTFTLSATLNTSAGGTYSIRAYTNLSTDGDRSQ